MVDRGRRFARAPVWLGVLVVLMVPFQGFAQCPTRCVGGTDNGEACTFNSQCELFACSARASCVHLEWRPQQVAAPQDSIVEIGLYAVSSNGFDQAVQTLDVSFSWDPSLIELVGNVDPCRACLFGTNADDPCDDDGDCPGGTCGQPVGCFDQCPADTYNWFESVFPNDCNLDGLNNPCTGNVPANDGNARYQAFKQILCGLDPAPPAFATPNGLHVTSFQFRVLAESGNAAVGFIGQTGMFTQTQVLGSTQPGTIVTGTLGPAAQIVISDCVPPAAVEGAGSRYLAVTPPVGGSPVAFLVTGDANNSKVSCVSQYVQADGLLGPSPVFRTPAQWGTVYVRGDAILSSTTYNVQTDCGGSLSQGLSGTTWKFGDANDDTFVDFNDIGLTVDGFRGVYYILGVPCTNDADCDCEACFPHFECNRSVGFCVSSTLENVDFSETDSICVADRVIDFSDISANVDAFRDALPPCPVPCP